MIQDSIVNKLNELENESYTIAGNITKIIPNNIDTRILVFYSFAQIIRSIKLYFILFYFIFIYLFVILVINLLYSGSVLLYV